MNAPAPYVRETVVWHPHVPGRIMPDVKFECVLAEGDRSGQDVVLLLTGFGEGEASGAQGVGAVAQRQKWAAATGLEFGQLSPEPADQERMATEGPQFLAEYFGGDQPVDLVAYSLSGLAVRAVTKAPELFRSVRLLAPFPLVVEHIGKVPLVGSTEFTRRADVALRLGLMTPLQLARYAFNGDVKKVGTDALGELDSYGEERNQRVDHGFHPETGRQAADDTVALMVSHGLVAAVGHRDRVVPGRWVRNSLHRAADRAGIDRSLVDERLLTVRGPHAPICTREGLKQLTDLLDHQLPVAADAL